ncbi:MAG: T9SS type A sorting domain-containing protein [Eudoraea sp.]|nr:T9SS type A sorting domain-containing protein [Eudoraea sp.]
MTTKLRLVLPITILFFWFCSSAQESYWQIEPPQEELLSSDLQRLDTDKLKFFSLDEGKLAEKLARLTTVAGSKTIIHLPDESGKIIGFEVWETPVFSPELSLKYPNIRSFSGTSIQNKEDRVRFSFSHQGLEVMLIQKEKNRNVFLEKTKRGSNNYVVYRREATDAGKESFICSTKMMFEQSDPDLALKLVDDQTLRTYRIAVSATGEYTQFHGGTVADALSAINATLTRVNEVFNTDLAISLELVANNDLIIYTDPATDPYQSNLNTEVQTAITNNIGELNYDVGHLFHEDTNGGNAGFIGAVCRDGQKGSAYSSSLNPQGDTYDLDYVSHELGHQFGANHTWSFESEGTGVQAEPASGSTIMGYAGIVSGENVQTNGDDYFHYNSIFQITEYIATTTCGVETVLTNTAPVLVPTENYTIPKSTAFVLSADATDADLGDVLTYSWEQIDNGVVTTATFGPQNPTGANFRSLSPTVEPERYFPKLSRVAQGSLTQINPAINSAWETVSDIERDLNFAVTVRDNALGGGQVASDLVSVRVTNSAGPFLVTSQDSQETYPAGSIQTVTWDVANTDIGPVNNQFVDIFVSIDGGLSYPTRVAEKVTNDGSHEVLLPGTATANGRFMVKAYDNIFFAINSADFVIEESPIVLSFEDLAYEICQPLDKVIPFVYETYGGFSETVTFSASGVPPGLGIAFVPGTATANNTPVELTISNTTAVAEGTYPIIISASGTTFTKDVAIDLVVFDTIYPDVTLTAPTDTEVGVTLKPDLTWETPANNISFDVEIATDVTFTNIVETATVIFKRYVPVSLLPETTYYWRVKPRSNCGEGTFGLPFSFTTLPVNCKIKNAPDLPISISSSGTPTVSSKIFVIDDLPISDLNVTLDLDHTFLSDLIITLISPVGTQVILTANSCAQFSNINAVFDDDAPAFVCNGDPGISGTIKPLGSLASFNGESSFGEWTLLVEDTATADGGLLNGVALEICVEGVFRPDADEDDVFDDGDDLCLGTPPDTEVNADGCPIYRFAPTNFIVGIESETCIENNDGILDIDTVESLNYEITVVGNGVNESAAFTDTYQLTGLASGTYDVCISGNDGTNTYEEFCFEVVVTEPDPLQASLVVNQLSNEATLFLDGSILYNIELNGSLIQTTADQYQLTLKNGLNIVKVTGSLECQGSFEEKVFIGAEPVLYPNPFVNNIKALLGTIQSEVAVDIYALTGRLLRSKEYRVNDNTIEIGFDGLASGWYIITIKAANMTSSYKVFKK